MRFNLRRGHQAVVAILGMDGQVLPREPPRPAPSPPAAPNANGDRRRKKPWGTTLLYLTVSASTVHMAGITAAQGFPQWFVLMPIPAACIFGISAVLMIFFS